MNVNIFNERTEMPGRKTRNCDKEQTQLMLACHKQTKEEEI